MLKRLVKQRKHYLSLARESFKNQETIKNGRPEIFSKNWRFLAKTGALEPPQFILRTILVITFHTFYQQHSERLSLWSSETKSHWHLNIKPLAFLNPCPKFNNHCIDLNNNRTDSTNTCDACVYSNVPKCTQKSLRKRRHRATKAITE